MGERPSIILPQCEGEFFAACLILQVVPFLAAYTGEARYVSPPSRYVQDHSWRGATFVNMENENEVFRLVIR